MKLNENELDNIMDDIYPYICDDLWNEFSIEWVQDYLNDTGNEYDNEDLNVILERLQDIQKNIQEQSIFDEKEDLYREIEDFIVDKDIHLSPTDIGRVLVKLAYTYLYA